MATITTLRPSTTSSGVGWTPSTGTLHGVTSDNSDATYATWTGTGSPMVLGTPVDAPPAGERRHQVRLTARGEDGDAWWAVRLSTGALVAGAAAQFASSPNTVVGSWGFGVPADGSTVLYAYVAGQSTGVKITELYLDMDSRKAPTFTAQILDGSGSANVTISDTAQPVIRAATIDLDNLNARQYRYWVTLNGAIVWDSGVTSGAAVNRQTAALDNGSYVAHLQIWSTLGQNTEYSSSEITLAFSILVGQVARPGDPTVEPIEGSPFYTIEACAPYVGDLDGAVGWVEIQRVDCPVGGYLTLPGSAGSYASTPTPEPDPAVTVLYPFSTAVEGWVAEGPETVQWAAAPVHDETGSIRMSKAMGVGPVALRFNDAHGALRDLSVNGNTITAWILLPAGAPGHDWVARLELQNTGYGWEQGPNLALVPGVWTQLTYTPNPALMASCRSIGIEFTGVDVSATQPVYLDTVAVAGPGLPPVDLEVAVQAGRDDGWLPAGEETLASHYLTTGNQRAWRLALQTNGSLILSWSTDGTSTLESAVSTELAPVDPFGNAWVRAQMVADNGTGVWAVTFSARDTEDSPWVQLGEVITGAVAFPLFASTADYVAGAYLSSGSPLNRWTGRIYSVEVRDGAAGDILVDPDFTNHLSGTTEFEDGQGNTWTVYSPAMIYSPTSTVTVAMLGPLASDACAEWVDYTLPRTGVGVTCEHTPDLCCSYYRARTVGRENGDLRISNWSDVYDPGIPSGVIVMWPSTVASIPSGWSRTTDLDGKYPKGIASNVTQPGTTGGATTHSHTLPTHLHDTSHAHGVTGSTGAAVGTATSGDGAVGTTAALSTHTHSRSSVASSAVSSDSATPGSGTAGNDPARLEVVFVESNGTPTGIPDGALALMSDIAVSGWTTYTAANNRFIKGAAPAGNGGATAASVVDAHIHSVDAHGHSGTSHTHVASNTGSTTSTRSLFAGSVPVLWQTAHTHAVTVGSTVSGSLASGGAGSSGAAGTLLPPYRNLRLNQKTAGAVELPVGLICAWRGSIGSIPDNWQLCDGTNGTPDMFGRYPRATDTGIGGVGGSLNPHSHTSPSHGHTTTAHNHTETISPSTAVSTNAQVAATVTVATATHTHTASNTDNTTPTVGGSTSGTLANTTQEPPYEEVAFIQMMAEPVPPPVPSLFCLDWDPDEHLIRTMTPEGPLWAAVLGKFDWTVTRPFTATTGINGGRFVTSAAPGARNLTMTAAVENDSEVARMHIILSRPLVLISPSDASEVWAAPIAESVRVVKVGRIRQITASFIGTGPQPPPQLTDVE